MRTHITTIFLIIIAVQLPSQAAADCEIKDTAATKTGTVIQGYMAVMKVIGAGRLQFYSAPDMTCKISNIFILSGEEVYGYIEYAGFTSVMYQNPKTANEVTGWVKSSRLKFTGRGIAPRP